MIPLSELSTPTHPADLTNKVKTPSPDELLQDWELGGVSLNDPSQGLLFQLWTCWCELDEFAIGSVYIQAPNFPKTLLFVAEDITEVSLAFDQLMNPFVAYVQMGDVKYYWYNPLIPGMVHSTLPPGCSSPRATLDDKRTFNADASDIIFSYVRAGGLYFRLQRDRYTIEYPLIASGITDSLTYVNMNIESRLQWRMGITL